MKYRKRVNAFKVFLMVLLALATVFLVGAGTVWFLISKDLSREVFHSNQENISDKTPSDMGLTYEEVDTPSAMGSR